MSSHPGPAVPGGPAPGDRAIFPVACNLVPSCRLSKPYYEVGSVVWRR